jgi:hypothetical protein
MTDELTGKYRLLLDQQRGSAEAEIKLARDKLDETYNNYSKACEKKLALKGILFFLVIVVFLFI